MDSDSSSSNTSTSDSDHSESEDKSSSSSDDNTSYVTSKGARRKHSGHHSNASSFIYPGASSLGKSHHGSSYFGNINVSVIKGQIATQQVDVIVNSASSDLNLNRGRASSALLSAAGNQIQRECQKKYPQGIRNGDIAVTRGGNLYCSAVYHAALPKYSSRKDEQTLSELIMNCLEQADSDQYQTIAFPPLGTGFLSYSAQRVAEIMFGCIRNFAKQTPSSSINNVFIVIYPTDNDNCYRTFEAESRRFLSAPVSSSTSSSSRYSPTPSSGGITKAGSQYIGKINIKIVLGALHDASADVLVCCGPGDLKMRNGALSGALLQAAGGGLQAELDNNYRNGVKFGEIAIAGGYSLRCKFVYYSTLPFWNPRSSTPLNVLEDLVMECLEEANNHSVTSIAFPTLGMGGLGYPVPHAVHRMVKSINSFSKKHPSSSMRDVIIVIYKGSQDCPYIQSEFLKALGSGSSSNAVPARTSMHSSPVQQHKWKEPPRGTKAYLDWKYTEELRTPPYWTKFTTKKKLSEWNLQSGSSCSLEKVDSNTFSAIQSGFKGTLQGRQIVSIERIENTALFAKYGSARQNLFRKAVVNGKFTPLAKLQGSTGPVVVMGILGSNITKHLDPDINECYLFHATKPSAVSSIVQQGLDCRLAAQGRLGSGVYGAEVASKSDGYSGTVSSGNNVGHRPMFLIRMCLGDIYLTGSGGNFNRPPCRQCKKQVCMTHHELYDSVVANGGQFADREFVVYDKNQSYPEYLIWYK